MKYLGQLKNNNGVRIGLRLIINPIKLALAIVKCNY
nr:MAG TPA: hypothetical protein [Caudoviricetes sp.]